MYSKPVTIWKLYRPPLPLPPKKNNNNNNTDMVIIQFYFNIFFLIFFNIFICFQFVEIKGSLFKKIDKGFLFHISCSDVKERFLYIVLLAIVFIRNMTEFSWDPRKKLDIDTIDKFKWIYLRVLSKYLLENLLYFCV